MARLFTGLLGVATVAWALTVLPGFWRERPLDDIARQIIAGRAFKIQSLAAIVKSVRTVEADQECNARAVRSAAILRLRMYEDAFNSEGISDLDVRTEELEEALRHALSCEPTDGFLWLVLFRIASSRNGFRSEYLDYLRQSYRLAPNEGWIALKRIPLLLAIYDYLPADLAGNVTAEFARIVDEGFYQEAVGMVAGPGWNQREGLVSRLELLPLAHRQTFARYLDAGGIRLTVPGVPRPDPKPYR